MARSSSSSNGSSTSSVKQMQCCLQWQPLEQRRAISGLTMLYKITNDLVAIPASNTLVTSYHSFTYIPYTAWHDAIQM